MSVDREAAQRVLAVEPGFCAHVARKSGLSQSRGDFTARAGIRQFLDLGSGIPTLRNVHEVARSLDPASRVVYVDSDPIAVALSHRIVAGSAGVVAIKADALQPDSLLQHPDVLATLDLHQPVAVLLVAFSTMLRMMRPCCSSPGGCGMRWRLAAISSSPIRQHLRGTLE